MAQNDGQLWFSDQVAANQPSIDTLLTPNAGATVTTQATESGDDTNTTSGSQLKYGVHAIELDTANNLYFTIELNSAETIATLYAKKISDNSIVSSQAIANNTNKDAYGPIAIDTANHYIFVSLFGGTGVNGTENENEIYRISYNPASGALGAPPYDPSTKTQTSNAQTIISEASDTTFNYAESLAVDSATSQLFYITGADKSGFTFPNGTMTPADNAIYVVSETGIGQTQTQVTRASQFSSSSALVIRSIALDEAHGLIYFLATPRSGTTDPNVTSALYVIPMSARGGAATLIAVVPAGTLPQGGLSGTSGSLLTYDPQSRSLYVANADGSIGTGAGPSTIYELALDGSGTTVTSTSTIAQRNGDIDNLAFDALPVLTATGTATHAVQNGAAIALLGATPTVTDSDSSIASATVSITKGGTAKPGDVLSLTDASGGTISYNSQVFTVAYNSTTDVLTITSPSGANGVTATGADYAHLLSLVQYQDGYVDASTGTPTRTVTFQVNDGAAGNPSGTNTATTTVTIDRPPPSVGGGGNAVSYTERGTAATVDGGVTVAENAGGNITGATVSITNGRLAGDGLNFTSQGGITGSYDTGTGVLTLSGSATAATYQTVLQSVSFSSTSHNPTSFGIDTSRTVAFQVSDPGGVSGTATSTVNISAVDDPPVVTAGNTLNYTENGAPTAISPTATVTDVDSANFNGGSLTVSFTTNGTGADQLTIGNQGSASGQIGVSGSTVTYGGATIGTFTGGMNGANLVVSFTTATATPTAATALLDDIQYANSSDVPSTLTRAVSYTVNDGGTNGTPTGSATASIAVTAVDDPPSFSNLDATPTATPGAPVVLDGNATIADPELDAANNYAGATLTLARHGGANAQDVFVGSGTLSLAGGVVTVGATQVGTDTNANGMLAITFNSNATTALVSSVLQQIAYSNTGTTNGSAQIDFTINDGNTVAQGTGGAESATGDVIVNVVADQPPVIGGTSTTPQSVNDNATISPFTGVTITDGDTANQTVTVTLTHPTFGSLSNLGGGTYTAATGLYTVSGTDQAVTTAVDGLVFTPTDNQIAPTSTESEQFTIASNDGTVTTTDTNTNVTITSVNDAPTITGTSATAQTVNDNATLSPFTGVTIGDVDNPAQTQTVTVTLGAPADGTLSTTSGFAATATAGVYTFSGTASAATAALDGLVFTPTNNQIAPRTTESEQFTIASNDGAGGSASDGTTNVTITSVDDQPMIGGTVASQTITDKQTVAPFATATIADPDVGASESVTITVTAGGGASDADGLLSGGTGLTKTGTGTYTLTTTTGSPSTVQAALRALTFTPTANQVPSGSVSTGFTLAVSDGIATPATTDSTTTVVAASVNDPPTATATATNPTFQQGGSAVALFSGASVSTVEAGQTIKDLTLTVSGLADGASETLSIDGASVSLTAGATANTQNGDSVSVTTSGGTATVTIGSSAGATPAALQTLIDGLTYSDTAAAPTRGARPVTLTSLMDDGGTTNGGSDTTALAIGSTATVAVPPVVAAGGSTTYVERGAADDVAPGLTLSDQNSATIASATVSITASFAAGDTLAAAASQGITEAYDASQGILTLTGTASLATYRGLLQGVTFSSSSHDPTAAGTDTGRTVSFQIDDGQPANPLSNVATAAVTVTAVDDAPVNAVPASLSFGSSGQGAVTGLSIADVDAGNGTVTTELAVTHGLLTVATVAGGAGVTRNGTMDVLLTGTVAAIDATLSAMNGVIYQGSAGTTDSLTVTTNDGGHTGTIPGNGPSLAAISMVPITVAAPPSDGGGPPPVSSIPTPGSDSLTGSQGNDTIVGLAGDDTISGGAGNDIILGNQGNDVITAGGGMNTVFGGMGNDLITVGDGSDLLYGDEGSDTIAAGNGNNTIVGGTGSSASDSLDGADYITSGSGNDLILGNGGDDTVGAGAGNDTVLGGYGNDVLLGNQGNDIILGNQGNDVIFGGFGDDTLVGGMGDDTLIGGQGNDVLYGNEGTNQFVFNPGDTNFTSDSGTGDTVMDFKSGIDKLHFGAGPAGTATNFGAASTTSTSFAAIQALGQQLLNGGDTYAFVAAGTDGYLFTTAGNGGGTGIADVVRLTAVKQMQASDIV